ncbi:MAG: sigma-70 family RNA polymerase sigma factor [Pirellulaceae bacterium]|nr:sigma-70 family RNA polymerase sigma factor [Pirellulaceae bacterium]
MNESPPDDKTQLPIADKGDRDIGEVFVQLLLEHEPQVRSFLRGLLPSWDDVDDVLQEAGLIAWRKFADFEQGTAFGGWFLTIARFEALAHRRRIARTPLVFADDLWELLADESVQNETPTVYRRHLETCLEKLPPEKRSILLRVHAPGVVMRDVALQTGRSEQAFYKVIQRLRTSLMQCVSKSLAAENA